MNRIPAEPERRRRFACSRSMTKRCSALVAREVIEATPGFESIGDAQAARRRFRRWSAWIPEMVLLDVRMPGLDGVEVARRLRATNPGTLVVLISVEEPMDIPSAAQLGDTIPLVRKQDLRPRLLRRLWREHRPLK